MDHHGLTMWVRAVDYVFAAAGLAGHAALLMILVRRRLATRLPLFFALIAFYFLRSAIFLLPASAPVELSLYWLLLLSRFRPAVAGHRRSRPAYVANPSPVEAPSTCSGCGDFLFLAISAPSMADRTIVPLLRSNSFAQAHHLCFGPLAAGDRGVDLLAAKRQFGKQETHAHHRPGLRRLFGGQYRHRNRAHAFWILRQATPYMALTYLRLLVYLSCLPVVDLLRAGRNGRREAPRANDLKATCELPRLNSATQLQPQRPAGQRARSPRHADISPAPSLPNHPREGQGRRARPSSAHRGNPLGTRCERRPPPPAPVGSMRAERQRRDRLRASMPAV